MKTGAQRSGRLFLAWAAAAALLLGGGSATASQAARPGAAAASDAALRRALGSAYARNRAALLARDAAAVIALRTADFEVVTPDGARHGAAEMAEFSRNLLANVERWEALSFDIESVVRRGDEAAAEIRQHSIRLMRRPTGKVERVENWVVQRETWVKTSAGWRMRRVDNIRDQRVLIDGVPRG
ncbi:MAG TPA: nuclear transport factor 2 family protein [Allosphingosinicella sp.]